MNNANKKYSAIEGRRRKGNRQVPDSVDLTVLFDGDTLPEDDSAIPTEPKAKEHRGPSSSLSEEKPSPAEPTPETTPKASLREAQTKALEVIHPHQYRLVGDLDYRPGEDGWGYLNRITPLLLKELVGVAMAPPSVVNAKVKLDALKELIQRPMPARTVYDIRTPAAGSEFDRMSDAQVMDFITKQIGDMRKDEIAESIAVITPEDGKPDK